MAIAEDGVVDVDQVEVLLRGSVRCFSLSLGALCAKTTARGGEALSTLADLAIAVLGKCVSQ
jgi:hypothetical protein